MIKKKLFKIVPLLLGICIIATIGGLHLSKRISAERMRIQEEQAREEAQIEKEQMLWNEHIAFYEYLWNGSEKGRSDYINVKYIQQHDLQIMLFVYEDYTGNVVTVEEIIAFLESEMDGNYHTTVTYEDVPRIKDYVLWTMEDYHKGNPREKEFWNIYDRCLDDYKTANGLTKDSVPSLLVLSLDDLAQLHVKYKNPDYKLTIDLTKWKKP